jgi:hypothetical protein
MFNDHYTIKLDGGKYTVISHRYPHGSRLEFLRHGEAWPAGDQLSGAKVVHAMLDRIEELEKAIASVVHGPPQANGLRIREETPSWVAAQGHKCAESIMVGWHNTLKNALEQKP